VAVLGEHVFGYEADIHLGLGGRHDWHATRAKLSFLSRAARHYDVFHFNFGSTLFQRYRRGRLRTEVPAIKRMGKTVLATFQGDDARPPSANPFVHREPEEAELLARLQAERRRIMLRYADRVFFVNPDLREWLPGAEFRAYANVDIRAIRPAPPPDGDEIVIAHAPSDRGIKGTDQVVEAVTALRAEGVAVRLDLVEGLPHSEAMRRFASADLAVDQLNLGWYGGFAVEMMALGRPVVCYIREEHPGDNPFGEELPIVRADAATLAERLRELIADRELRMRLGREGRDFVEREHDPRRVARRNLEGLVDLPPERP
jgi:glycosyltransferase involved in cell wall biosynthesis